MKKRFFTLILTLTAMLMCIFGLTTCGDKEISFKLNFVVDETVYATIDTSGDEVIALPENPKKENHSFDGWFWDKDVWNKPFTANSLLDAPLSSDMSVYAKFILNTIDGVTFEDVETTYDGTEKTLAVSNLPNGASVTYDKANTYTNAGEYTVTATIIQENHEDLQLTATLKINKAAYDMSGVVFADKAVTYNGESHSITATNLPNGVTVEYTGNNQTNADEYMITATFTGDSANYEPIADKTATLTINKARVSKPAQDSTSFVYNGNEQTYLLAENSLYTISGNKQTNAGNHTVTVSLKDKNNYQWSDETATDLSYSFDIAKATYDMSAVVFADKTVTYNGEIHSVIVTNIPNGVSVDYENNNKMNADTYTVIAKFTDTTGNYENPADKTATLIINKATYDMSGVAFADKTVTYNGNAYSIEAQNVPSGLSVSYTGNDKTNVDAYTVTATFTDKTGNYENPENMTATLVINKATITGITFTDKTVTYDTKTHALAIDGNLPACVKVTYTNNDKVNANTYTITASFTDTSGNYIVPEDMSAKLIINKATVSGISFEDKTFTYNGEKRSLAISGTLPEEVTVSYVNNGKTNANTYNVTATFACETENYVVPEDVTAVLTIKKAMYDMSTVTFENKTVTYDGKIHSLAVSDNLPDGVSVAYENNDKISANQYIVIAIFTGDSINYYAIDDMQAMLTISKATYDMSKAQFVGGRFTYDGTPKSIYVTGNLPDGVTVNYTNNGKINANTYTVTATFTSDTENYNKLPDWTASLIIDKATYDMSGVSFKNQTFTYDTTAKNALITGTLPNGVEVSYVGNGKTDVGTYTVTAKFNGDSNNYHLIDDMTATLKINQAVPYIKEVSCNQSLNEYSTAELIADTDVAGTIALDSGQTLTLGYKTYSWTFIPEDTHNYTIATGTVGLTVCALVSYYNDGVLFSSQNIVLNNSATVPTGTPLRADSNGYRYTFSHWSIEENGVEYNFTNVITADLNLYAVYDSEEIVYAINYYDTKDVEHENITNYTVSTVFTLLSLEKEHYVFNGWTDKDGNAVTNIRKGTFGALNLYATWTPIEYAITYDLGYRGAVNGNNPTTYNVEDSFSFVGATYDEYHTFVGWYLEENFINQKTSISIGESGAITLYAKWNFSGTYISTVSELQNMAYNMAGVYELKNDIDLTNASWTPIGDSINPFTGYFNGAELSVLGNQLFREIGINGKVNNVKTSTYITSINYGKVYNVHSTNSTLIDINYGQVDYCSGGNGLINYNENGFISNSWSLSGFARTKSNDYNYSDDIGGLIARSLGGRIENCFYAGELSKSKDGVIINFGGLIGKAEKTYMSNCYFQGIINDHSVYHGTGGLAGRAINCSISNCYVVCDFNVSSRFQSYLGVLIGYADADCTVKNCFSSGNVTYNSAYIENNQHGSYSYVGLLLGIKKATVENCYYDMDSTIKTPTNSSSVLAVVNSGTACGVYNLKSVYFMKNTLCWDQSIWILEDGQYPKLRFELE